MSIVLAPANKRMGRTSYLTQPSVAGSALRHLGFSRCGDGVCGAAGE